MSEAQGGGRAELQLTQQDVPEGVSSSQRSYWSLLLRALVGVGLVVAVFSLINLENLSSLLTTCRLKPLLHAFLLFAAGSVSSAWAWQLLIEPLGYRLPLLEAGRLSLVGFFFNNLVPTGVGGDVYRIYAACRKGVSRSVAAASVFAERWTACIALLLATYLSFALAMPLLSGVKAGVGLGEFWSPLSEIRLDWLMGVFLVLLSLGFLGGCFWLAYCSPERNRWLKRQCFGVPLDEFLCLLKSYRHYPGRLAAATVINLASPLLEGLAFSSIADALGLQLSPLLFLAFTPIFRVLNHLPITINAVGTQEVASVVFWNSLGAAPAEAVAISVLIHALKLLVSLIGAPLYFVGRSTPIVKV